MSKSFGHPGPILTSSLRSSQENRSTPQRSQVEIQRTVPESQKATVASPVGVPTPQPVPTQSQPKRPSEADTTRQSVTPGAHSEELFTAQPEAKSGGSGTFEVTERKSDYRRRSSSLFSEPAAEQSLVSEVSIAHNVTTDSDADQTIKWARPSEFSVPGAPPKRTRRSSGSGTNSDSTLSRRSSSSLFREQMDLPRLKDLKFDSSKESISTKESRKSSLGSESLFSTDYSRRSSLFSLQEGDTSGNTSGLTAEPAAERTGAVSVADPTRAATPVSTSDEQDITVIPRNLRKHKLPSPEGLSPPRKRPTMEPSKSSKLSSDPPTASAKKASKDKSSSSSASSFPQSASLFTSPEQPQEPEEKTKSTSSTADETITRDKSVKSGILSIPVKSGILSIYESVIIIISMAAMHSWKFIMHH